MSDRIKTRALEGEELERWKASQSPTVVIEVHTVERTERRYVVELRRDEHEGYDEEELKVKAEELVRDGSESFTEGNADIEEVISVQIREDKQ